MNDLITRVLSGEASDIELQQLRRWRRESAENERGYLEMEHVWRLSALQTLDEPISPPPVEVMIAEAELRRAKVVPLQSRSVPRAGIRRWVSVVVAAVSVWKR